MTKEELEKEAWQYADKVCGWDKTQIFDYLVEAYLASAEPREKRIEELEKENAELKSDNTEWEKASDKWESVYELTNSQLTKAKEILAKLLEEEKNNMYWEMNGSDKSSYYEVRKQAEQFLNSEVEK